MCMNVAATEWFVDRTRHDDSGNGKSMEAAKRTIQAAVSAASAGDVVTVLPGVYDEGGDTFTASSVVSSNRVYITKNITLRSRDGAAVTHIVGAKDLTVAQDASPWGMGPAAVRCIAVAEDLTNVSIEGFTIRDGATDYGTDAAPRRGAGVLNVKAMPKPDGASCIVVSNCVFRGNTGTRGGAAYGIKAVDCVFTENRASSFGAAVRECCLERCLIYRNGTLSSANVGAIAYGYTVLNCTIAYNETLSAFSNYDTAANTYASNCIAVANNGCNASTKLYTSITDSSSANMNGCVVVASGTRLFVAPAVGDFRLRAESEAVTANPAIECYCGAVQEAVSCAGSGCLEFATASGGTMYVDGMPVRSRTYVYAVPWPRAFAVTFAPDMGKGLVCYQYGGLSRWPTMDEVYYVIPPVSGTAAVEAVTGEARYVAQDGNDAADGSEATPWRTLQGAMDGLARDSIFRALVYVHPGRYNEGGTVARGVSNRVVFASNSAVRLKALEGPEKTFIVGAEDPNPAVANSYCLGPNAMRCVAFCNSGHSVQGFTLTGGRTSVNANNSDSEPVRGGAVISMNGTGRHNSALLDCVVTNCVASRGAAIFGGFVERCLLVNNVVASGGNAITRTGWVRSSIYTRNLGNTTVGQDSSAHNCTVVSNYSPIVHLYSGTSSTSASNTLFAANAGGNDIERRTGTDFCVYEDLASGVTLPTSVKETTLFADYLRDDFRPYAASAGSYFGDPRAFADGSCFADFYGKPFPISPNGRITAGAVSDLVTSLRIVSPVPGGTDVEGIFTEFPVTVTATRADRQLLGFEVNGATQAVSGASVTVTAEQLADFTSFIVKPVYNTDWWVDATNGDDANTGWDAAHAKKTLAGAMSHAWDGDTVHALPGVYNTGTMVQDNPFLTATTKSNTDVVIPSRVVVQTNVTLVAEGAADETVIEGGIGTKNSEYGLGLDAVRCVYLNRESKVNGFTLRGGRTDWTNEMDENSFGGGAVGRSTDGNAVEDCVVTGCVSHRGGAGFNVTFRRCRIVGNRVTGNSPAGRQVALYGCYVADNLGRDGGIYSGVVQYHGDIVGCTFAADNGLGTMAGRTADCRLTVGQQPGYRFWNNVVAMPYNRSEAQVLSNAYHNVFSDAIRFDVLEGADNIVASLEEIALGPDGVPCHGSVAIDASSFEHALTNLTGEAGLNGVRRGLGGGVDPGAFEFDWLPQFAQDLGGKRIVVTEVDNDVFENGDGLVEMPSGDMSVSWTPAASASASCPCTFRATVTGTGTLTVKKNGEVLGTYTQGAYDVNFFGSGTMALAFAYVPGENDEGGAVLSGFSADIGTMLILR